MLARMIRLSKIENVHGERAFFTRETLPSVNQHKTE